MNVSNHPPKILFSVLVPTVPQRTHKLHKLLSRLDPQVERPDVELLVLRDNRSMTIGEKRNRLRAAARGEYVAFVDDDDMVTEDYVSTLLGAVSSRVDVINFLVRVEGHGPPKLCRYGLALRDANLESEYQRRPNHIMAWRRAVALEVPFADLAFGEDTRWAEEVTRHAKSELIIPRVLYTYQFDPKDNSGTPR